MMNVGRGNTYTSNRLQIAHVFTVDMILSIACAAPSVVSATPLTMLVNAATTPTITLTANSGSSICAGAALTLQTTTTKYRHITNI